jgi:sterol desaturase/sphingolipid hydroxylase (fatty acid hydroxylase superfamily)
MTNVLAGGLITLPSEGWLLVLAVAAYTMVMDFGEYLFHLAQHRIPALWAMHSFHHSDGAMNISTTQRHFWAKQAIKTVTIYFLVGLLFKVNAQIVTSYGIISICNFFFHLNIPVGFGRGWFLLNSPQYHRVHHSSLPEHQDKNFAALFPIFDVIFGVAYRPHPGEFPQTGLYDGDSPRGVIEAVIWPACNVYRRQLVASHRS